MTVRISRLKTSRDAYPCAQQSFLGSTRNRRVLFIPNRGRPSAALNVCI